MPAASAGSTCGRCTSVSGRAPDKRARHRAVCYVHTLPPPVPHGVHCLHPMIAMACKVPRSCVVPSAPRQVAHAGRRRRQGVTLRDAGASIPLSSLCYLVQRSTVGAQRRTPSPRQARARNPCELHWPRGKLTACIHTRKRRGRSFRASDAQPPPVSARRPGCRRPGCRRRRLHALPQAAAADGGGGACGRPRSADAAAERICRTASIR